VMGLLGRERSMEMRGIEMEEMVLEMEEEQRKAGREARARGVREGGATKRIGGNFWGPLPTASNSSKSYFAKRRLRLGISLSTRAGVRFQINAAAAAAATPAVCAV
jgi:hypothetical protein